MGQLFNENEKLIGEEKEITGASTLSFERLHVDVDKLTVQ